MGGGIRSVALNKMGRTDEALAVCVEGLKIAPYNRQLANLRDAIEHPEHLLNHLAERNTLLPHVEHTTWGDATYLWVV